MGTTGKRPVIGMCAHVGPMNLSVYNMQAAIVPEIFVTLVSQVGGLPVLLPPVPEAVQALRLVDGLLLLPGPDIDPSLYGAAPHPQTRYNGERDRVELDLLTAALEAGIPTLGICRGLQLLNTAYGGTLHQHLPEVLGNDNHQPGEQEFGSQLTVLEPNTQLARTLGADRYTVPCHHHQAIDRLGAGLQASARSADGVIEAVEVPNHPFTVAVQWHAEKAEDDPFVGALVEAARQFAGIGVR